MVKTGGNVSISPTICATQTSIFAGPEYSGIDVFPPPWGGGGTENHRSHTMLRAGGQIVPPAPAKSEGGILNIPPSLRPKRGGVFKNLGARINVFFDFLL